MSAITALIIVVLSLLVFGLFLIADAVSAVSAAVRDHADAIEILNKETSLK